MGLAGWIAMGIGLLMLAIAAPTFIMAGTLVDVPPRQSWWSLTRGEQSDDAPTVLREGRQGDEGHRLRTTADHGDVLLQRRARPMKTVKSLSLYVLNPRSTFNLPPGDTLELTNQCAAWLPNARLLRLHRSQGNVELVVFVNQETGEEEVLGVGVAVSRHRPGRSNDRVTTFATLAIASLDPMGSTRRPVRACSGNCSVHMTRTPASIRSGRPAPCGGPGMGRRPTRLGLRPARRKLNCNMPYVADNPEVLLPEHPNNLETHLATFTMYSVWDWLVAAVTMLGIYLTCVRDRWTLHHARRSPCSASFSARDAGRPYRSSTPTSPVRWWPSGWPRWSERSPSRLRFPASPLEPDRSWLKHGYHRLTSGPKRPSNR